MLCRNTRMVFKNITSQLIHVENKSQKAFFWAQSGPFEVGAETVVLSTTFLDHTVPLSTSILQHGVDYTDADK